MKNEVSCMWSQHRDNEIRGRRGAHSAGLRMQLR